MPVYDQIGTGYDTTRKADRYITDRLAFHLQIKANQAYLDLACGTGNYTTALASMHSGVWTGLDISDTMISEARRKSKTVTWLQSNCENIPFSEHTFDGVVCTLAIHHFSTLGKAFREVFRVMRAGRFVIFTSTPEQMQRYWLCRYFPESMRAAMKQMPAKPLVEEALHLAGFKIAATEPYSVKNDLEDFFLYSGKFNPSLYLDAVARSGISTFANLASEREVTQGCEQLSRDIQSGKIIEIQREFEHDAGDYLFLIAEKDN
ncbi:MAG TPA: class I SAM-dependent methyltransferase [Drouetiella sp.]|jgi:ubiquinone/menaquinone biosynthesis C-methylase UbiE